MEKLWYGADEVKCFHPVVEKCLNEALKRSKLNSKYEVKHHFGAYTKGIPDFCVLDKITGDFVCIIEVKKTPSDVFAKAFGEQAKGYVEDVFGLRWKNQFHPYFCVTNIELTQFFSFRQNSSLIGCLLTGSPFDSGFFTEQAKCEENFTNFFKDFFIKMDKKTEPEFSKHLEAISESFNETFYDIAKILEVNLSRMDKLIGADQIKKQKILYELLRFAFYYYIRESYQMNNSDYFDYFKEFEVDGLTDLELVRVIQANFERAMEIDFADILRNYDEDGAIIPDGLISNNELGSVFNAFIQTLRDNAQQGIQKNHNLDNFVSLLTEEIYNKEEMHKSGKIMSDEVLSNILSETAISSHCLKVIDPCCGDGNLLTASYRRIAELAEKSEDEMTHNEILSCINGIEVDPNLIQLAAFKLICKNLNDVNQSTITNLNNMDLFETDLSEEYDSLVMNPPFLRNEDVLGEIKNKYLSNIEMIKSSKSFIRAVRQPNLYFYFIEKSISMLRQGGKASIILMTKFLNNEDGEYLKKFLLPYTTAIISYPPTFFEGFKVTTCILLLSKNHNSDGKISFLKVFDTDILSNIDKLKKILGSDEDIFDTRYSLVNVKKQNIQPKDNWRKYLIDPESKFEKFESLDFLQPICNFFTTVKRGCAGNSGGSSIIYPFSSNNPLADVVEKIEQEFIGFGLRNNKLPKGRRKFILGAGCLEKELGLLVPEMYNHERNNGLSSNYLDKHGLNEYYEKAKQTRIKNRLINWEKIVNTTKNSIVKPKILIPRGDRKKHSIYYNPFKEKSILVSTNFCYLDGLKNSNPDLKEEEQLKFIAAWLLSSFGQIQFEMHSNNQEGMRKFECGMINRLKIPNLKDIEVQQIRKVVKDFEILSDKDVDFIGLENENDPRKDLDYSIGEIVFNRNNMGFQDYESLVDFFKDFLMELVLDRVNQ